MVSMLLILLCLALTTILFIACKWFDSDFCGAAGCVGIVVLAVMVILACTTNLTAKGFLASNQQLYNSLVYQLDNNLYDNDNDVGKQELYEKITEWNCDLARGKVLQHDLWIGIFYANIYDDFNFIELKE